jgi:hypothetical protein
VRRAVALGALAVLLGSAAPASAVDDGSTVAVSRPTGFGGPPAADATDSFSDDRSTSADGTKVVFTSQANALSPDDNDSVRNVYVRDRTANTTTLVSRSTSGAAADADSFEPVISADGNWVAFSSAARNLASDDADGAPDVFVRHLPSGTTNLVSRTSGTPGQARGGRFPSISANGLKVAFVSFASFEAADNNGIQDAYLRDIAGATTQLISRSDGPSGAVGTDLTFDVAISGNGERIAFSTNSTLDAVADTNGTEDVYMRDITTHATTLISRANTATGAVADNGAGDPSINNTGSRIAFSSAATNLTDDTDTNDDVFVRDLTNSSTVLISRATGVNGASADQNSLAPSIDSSGTKVAFLSAATNFGDGTPAGIESIRLRDTTANTTTVVSRASGASGAIGNGAGVAISQTANIVTFYAEEPGFSADDSNDFQQVYSREVTGPNLETDLVSRPSGTGPLRGNGGDSTLSGTGRAVSADGRYIVFTSLADGISADDGDDFANVYRRDIVTGDTVLVSRASGASGAPANSSSFRASISADGDRIAFESDATNLVPGDGNDKRDVFVRTISAQTTDLVSRHDGAGGAQGDTPATEPDLSGNGRFVAFSSASDLSGDDTDGLTDIFRRDLVTGQTVLISRASGPGGANTNAPDDRAVVDTSGDHVAFLTKASNLDAADSGTDTDLYVRDVGDDRTTLASRGDGFGAPSRAAQPGISISGDGSRVAFSTGTPNLVSDDTTFHLDVFVRDLAVARTLLVSRSSSGEIGNTSSLGPSLSGDGSRVAFVTAALNLVPDAPHHQYTALRSIGTGTTIVAGMPDAATGAAASDFSDLDVALDGAGHCVAFVSLGTNLLPGGSGTGEFQNVFLHALGGTCPEPAPAIAPPPPGPGGPGPGGPAADSTAPALAGTAITPKRFAVDKKPTPVSARAKKGAKFAWRLSEPAQVTLVIERSQPGRRKGRRCVKPTRKLRKAKKCARWVPDGTLKRRAVAGKGGTAFTGRIGRKALKPGKHRARITATDAAGNKSAQRIVTFTIVRR